MTDQPPAQDTGFRDAAVIRSYHAHIYYEPETRPEAERLRVEMERLFPAAIYGRWHDVPVGPHPSAMYQVAFPVELFPTLAPWLIVNRGNLTVFLHPNTGKALTDHTRHAVWMGRQQVLDLRPLSDD
ncbi:MAG TPA: DOPA 4,5-dioxygenase family protein [Xanthobacteraceae bacterium]|nr:DOPA 4,5-dioxygenase family protein [Xanthobacteraceae bacterium]